MFVTREDDRLFAQLTGQRRFEVFAESPTAFFWRIAEARMKFVAGAEVSVTRPGAQSGWARYGGDQEGLELSGLAR